MSSQESLVLPYKECFWCHIRHIGEPSWRLVMAIWSRTNCKDIGPCNPPCKVDVTGPCPVAIV
ncbi:hypothetical protein TNCT_331451, partial [Trichonephila clavata]